MSDWTVHLEFEEGNSSKFWRARVEGKTLYVNYGKIGSAGQTQVNGFYSKSIDALVASFKENGIDLLTPNQFLDTKEKSEFYYGFVQESAKKEKTEFRMIGKLGTVAEISSHHGINS